MLSNARQHLLSLIVIFLSLGAIGYLYLQSQTTYYAESDSYVQIGITPPALFTTDASYDISWQSERITAIYLNEQGKVGAFTETFAVDVCQSYEFLVNFENGDQQTLHVRPFLISHPLVVSLLTLSVIALTVLLQPLNIPILKSIGNYFAPLFQWGGDGFWHKWLILILGGLSLYIGFLYLGSGCQEQPVSAIGQHFQLAHLTLMGTGVLAFFGFIIVVLRAEVSQMLQSAIRLIPYPVVVTGVFVYWGCCFFILLLLNTLVDTLLIVPLCLLIFMLGAMVLHTRLQPDPKLSNTPAIWQLPSGANRVIVLLIAGIIWIVAYRTNWVAIVHNDLLQIGIGIILFLLPGMLLTLILLPKLNNWSTLLTTGFILSFALSSGVWLVAVLLSLSADMMQWLYTLLGLSALMVVSVRGIPAQLFRLEQDWQLSHTMILSLGMLSILMIASIQVEPGFGHINGDYTHYNPLVMDYAQSSTINLLDPYLGSGNNMLQRMWMALWTVPQSLIIAFSQMHILVSFQLIAVYLTILWAIVMYDMTRRMDVPTVFSLMAIPIGVFFLTTHLDVNQIGLRFVATLPHDKLITSLVITPLAIVTTFEYLQKPSRTGLFLTIITTMCVMMGHPTVYFYTCVVLGAMTCLYVIGKSHQWRHIVIIALICGFWMTIPLSIRIIQASTGYVFLTDSAEELLEILPQRADRSNVGENGEFLGINPELSNSYVYLTLIAAFVLSLIYYRRSTLFYLIIPIGLLLIGVLNPYTSILIGWFVTLSQLWRMPWVIPYGVIATMALWLFCRLISDRLPNWKPHIQIGMVILGFVLSMTSFILVMSPAYHQNAEIYASYDNLALRLIQKRDHPITSIFERYQALGDIATAIRVDNTDEIIILADNALVYQIPGMGADFYSMIWHTASTPNISFAEFDERNEAYAVLFSDALNVETFTSIIKEYQINYILLSKPYRKLEDIMSRSDLIQDMNQFGSVRLWKILLQE